MSWTIEEKYFASQLILRQNLSKPAKFRRKFNNYPPRGLIYCWVHKFQATGSVYNLHKKAENPRSGRKLTASCPDNVDAVRVSVGGSPKKSLQRHSQELGFSRTSFQRILKKDLPLYPYRIQIKHKFTPADMEKPLCNNSLLYK